MRKPPPLDIRCGHTDAAPNDETCPDCGADMRVWQVTRFCCRSGMCVECHKRGGRRARILHADRLTSVMADRMLAGWSEFDPIKSIMPVPKEVA